MDTFKQKVSLGSRHLLHCWAIFSESRVGLLYDALVVQSVVFSVSSMCRKMFSFLYKICCSWLSIMGVKSQKYRNTNVLSSYKKNNFDHADDYLCR